MYNISTRGSESGKTNSFFDLISHQLDIHKIYLHAKDSYEAKYQFLIKKLQQTAFNHSLDIDFIMS